MKKNNIITILFILVCLIGIVIGYLIFNNSNDIILEQLTGIWGHCTINELSNKVCYIVSIEENNGTYSYRYGIYQTDGVISGVIKEIKKDNKNKYEIEVFSEGCKGNECMEETEDITYNYEVDITNINDNKIIIEEKEYKYITDDVSNTQEIDAYINK